MMFWLLNKRFTFKELENNQKKYVFTDSFFCHCTSTEGTYHRQFEKCVRFPIFRFQTKLLSSFQTKCFKCSHKKIHVTESNWGKYLEPRKEITRFAWSKPLQKSSTSVTFDHSRWFSWTKTIISFFFITTIITYEVKKCKEKTYLDRKL